MDYNDMQRALLMVYAAKLMVDNGKEEDFRRGLSGWAVDSDDCYSMIWEALPYACDEMFNKYYENSETERFWFFDQSMIDFYKLCRAYNERNGIAPDKDPNLNPYFKEAGVFVGEELSFRAFTCDYALHTDVTRKGRCRIVFVYDCYFDGLFHLMRGVYAVFSYYRQKAKELRELLDVSEKTEEKEAA